MEALMSPRVISVGTRVPEVRWEEMTPPTALPRSTSTRSRLVVRRWV